MKYCFAVKISHKPDILDPAGKTTRNALQSLGVTGVKSVEIGKLVQMEVDAETEKEAKQIVEQSCKMLLVNPNIEVYSFKRIEG